MTGCGIGTRSQQPGRTDIEGGPSGMD